MKRGTMRIHMSAFIILLAAFLSAACDFVHPDVEVNESGNQTIATDETVHLNNCGGKADSKQTAEHSFAASLEGTASLKISPSIIEGSISAKYGQYRNVSKSQELTAPPKTNMEFILRWTEQQWFGAVIAGGQSGTYKAQVPLSVELVSSRDLGCGATSQQPSTPLPQLPPLPSSSPEIAPSNVDINVTVEANQGWQSTGVSVVQGQQFRIQYISGQWTYWRGTIDMLDANGDSYICSATSCCEPMPHNRKGALIGKVGNEVFFVGNGSTFTANYSGQLSLRINDCDDIDLADNVGAVSVKISP
jgi:hypothetical protein